ncbi:MAG: phosphomannomutase [Nitrospirae bacterium]|nr:MAG: phosphomannomutase [Nitrospirota bacterium]
MKQAFSSATECWKTILADAAKNASLLSTVEQFARANTAPVQVVFGTSGWRGEIGTDYTFRNLHIVTAAIIESLQTGDAEFCRAMGVDDFKEVQRRGVIVGHDNRFLGKEFALDVIGLLETAGIRTWYAGEATTPEFSSGIGMLKAAAAINLTPSHNPANYAGFKFNPADGGPAGTEITSQFEKIANRMMSENAAVSVAPPERVEKIDLMDLYIKYLAERKTIDLDRILSFVRDADCIICVDHVHGSTKHRLKRILGESEKIVHLRENDDILFGGIAPEPSEKNMEGVMRVLNSSEAKFRIGAIMDPDGDRIRHADATLQIPMNYFGAMALHFLHVHKGYQGIVAKSVGTSNFVNAIASKLNIPIRETKVGFKNFRPYLLPDASERAIAAFEESDGISGYNHTLEKDAMFGLLLAIEMVATLGKNLGEYLQDIMNEFGAYYPDRSGIGVDRSLAGAALVQKLSAIQKKYPTGSKMTIGGVKRTVANLITVDGTKLVFDDGSWLMIRPSGTEPKVRFYIEARTEAGKQAVFDTAERLTKEALGIV